MNLWHQALDPKSWAMLKTRRIRGRFFPKALFLTRWGHPGLPRAMEIIPARLGKLEYCAFQTNVRTVVARLLVNMGRVATSTPPLRTRTTSQSQLLGPLRTVTYGGVDCAIYALVLQSLQAESTCFDRTFSTLQYKQVIQGCEYSGGSQYLRPGRWPSRRQRSCLYRRHGGMRHVAARRM